MKSLILGSMPLLASFLMVSSALAQPFAEFKLGFRALADRIPDAVGVPIEEERWGPNGDSLQQTTTGLMVWRKADNWTAFTNGSRTWVNGPLGVAERGVDERFSWEGQAPPPTPNVSAPTPVSPNVAPIPTAVPAPASPLAGGPVPADQDYGYYDDKGVWVPLGSGAGDCH